MSVCLERTFLIPDATVDSVTDVCHKILRDMRLKIIKREAVEQEQTTILAGEGSLIPLITKVLLYPLGLDDYVQAAQRSGVHIVISPADKGVYLRVCGIALGEATGKPEEYTKEDFMEEVTDTLEAWNFEDRFINRIKAAFPKTKEIDQ